MKDLCIVKTISIQTKSDHSKPKIQYFIRLKKNPLFDTEGHKTSLLLLV